MNNNNTEVVTREEISPIKFVGRAVYVYKTSVQTSSYLFSSPIWCQYTSASIPDTHAEVYGNPD